MLWTIRAWVIGHCHGKDAEQGIRAVFDRLGAPQGALALGQFMGAIGNGARRTIEVNCVCYPEVTDDEQALLRVLALEQYDEPDDAYATLRPMIAERHAAAACANAQRLGHLLESAGHLLRPVPSEVEDSAEELPARETSHGTSYLH
jgi:hypothetical protein